MGRRRMDYMQVALVLVLAAVILAVYRGAGGLPVAPEYLAVLPSILVIAAGGYVVATEWRPGSRLGGFIILGLGFAYLVQRLYELGVLAPSLLSASLSLRGLQFLVFLAAVLVGVLDSY